MVRVDADAIGRHCEVSNAHGASIHAMAGRWFHHMKLVLLLRS